MLDGAKHPLAASHTISRKIKLTDFWRKECMRERIKQKGNRIRTIWNDNVRIRIGQINRIQAPVVQTLDSTIRRINHYPADKYCGNQLRYPVDSDLSGG